MEVKVTTIMCLCVILGQIQAANVKSKPGTLDEETYGALEDADTDVQRDSYDDYLVDSATGELPLEESNDTTKNEYIKVDLRTKPQLVIAKLGDTVMLPCEVSNSDSFLTWKKENFLYQGHIAVNRFPNIIEHSNNTLEVKILSENDYGQYTCKIFVPTENSPEVIHTIVPPTPPKILSLLPANNKTVYRVGETLTLTCLASGYPKPEISWYKHKDNGERIGTKGETLTITNLKFKNAGIYRCLADNKVGPAAHHHIEINVEHKPVVMIDKYIVNSDHENDVELKCTVHAYPPAVVVWKNKNGQNIIENPPKVTLKRHQNNIENILIISDLKEDDFGTYTCYAKNSLDKVEKSVNLVKTPVVQEFVKPEKGNKDVELTWKVESKSPIFEHELQYRKQGEESWKNVKPKVMNGEKDIYTVKYTLKGLEQGSYETRVRSQNTHGWSEFSDVMPFEGAKHGSSHKQHSKKHHKEKDLKEKQVNSTPEAAPAEQQENDRKESSVGASQTGGCTAVRIPIPLISIVLLILCYNRH